MIIKEHLNNLIVWLRRKNEIRKMVRDYKKRIEVEKVLEEYISFRILDGQAQRRDELVQKQGEIKEFDTFLKFLKTL